MKEDEKKDEVEVLMSGRCGSAARNISESLIIDANVLGGELGVCWLKNWTFSKFRDLLIDSFYQKQLPHPPVRTP